MDYSSTRRKAAAGFWISPSVDDPNIVRVPTSLRPAYTYTILVRGIVCVSHAVMFLYGRVTTLITVNSGSPFGRPKPDSE